MGEATGKGSRHATSHDVASLAGVSQPTVSRALRDSPSVRPETRERVKAAAEQLGYRPHRAAAQLRGARSGNIALVLLSAPGAARASLNPFYYDLVGAVEAAAAQRQLSLTLSYQSEQASLRCDFEQRGEADGVIVIGSASNRAAWQFFSAARASGCNIIGWGTPDDSLPTVRADNQGGAMLAVEHLVARGCRRIAFIGPDWQQHHAYAARRDGYLAALARHGLAAMEGTAPVSGSRAEQGEAAVAQLLSTGVPFDAVFAACDGLALGATRGLTAAARRVPEDVAVIGFDGSYHSRDSNPALTTIEQDIARAGTLLVEAVIDGQAADPHGAMAVPVKLVARASA